MGLRTQFAIYSYILHLKLAGETMYQLSSACIPHTCAPSSSSLCCVVLWFVVITTTHIKMYGASVISGLISTFYMCVLVMYMYMYICIMNLAIVKINVYFSIFLQAFLKIATTRINEKASVPANLEGIYIYIYMYKYVELEGGCVCGVKKFGILNVAAPVARARRPAIRFIT